jgi:ubiquinone/menaquinone biosynthesis C-methylase UbiE
VLHLGSGAGFDCFLAAARIRPAGKVIGVDMTPEMIEKSRKTAERSRAANLEFRLGEIEDCPSRTTPVDVVISNCVINLSPDKPRVFQEIHRVLKTGGRVAISDIALLKPLPQRVSHSVRAYVGCVGGAVLVDRYTELVEASGLKDVKITVKAPSSCVDRETQDPMGRALTEGWDEAEDFTAYVTSVSIEALK